MTTLDWIIFVAAWSLIPLALYLRHRQAKRFQQWKREDDLHITEWTKQMYKEHGGKS